MKAGTKVDQNWLKTNTTKDQRRTVKMLPQMDLNMARGSQILLHRMLLDGSMVVCYPRHNGRARFVRIGVDGHVSIEPG